MFCSESSSKSAMLQSDMNSMTVVLSLWVEDPSVQVRMMMQWDDTRDRRRKNPLPRILVLVAGKRHLAIVAMQTGLGCITIANHMGAGGTKDLSSGSWRFWGDETRTLCSFHSL